MLRGEGLVALLFTLVYPLDGAVHLTGRVTDANNAPVAAARVQLECGAQTFQAASDDTGGFQLQLPAAGEYRVRVQREGFFELRNHTVELSEGDNEVTLLLTPQREVVQSVSVSASPPGIDFDRTTAKTSVTGNQILEVPYPVTHSLRSATRLLPNVVQDNNGGIHIDGGAEEQVLYTLDGFNLNDPITGKFESRLSVEAVRSLEISSGRLPAEWGKGSAGTFAVKTGTGEDQWHYSGTNFIPGVSTHKGLGLQDWTPRFNLSGPLRKGRAWFSESLDAQFIRTLVEDLPEGRDRTSSWRINNLLRNQVNLTPSNILFSGFLLNAWTAPQTGLGALDPPETTVDRRSRQWFFDIRDQAYFRPGALVEIGYAANRTFGREIPQGHALFRLTPFGRQGNYFVDAVRKASRDQWLANVFLPAFQWHGSHQLKAGVDLDHLDYRQDVRRTGYEHFRSDGTRLMRVTFAGSGVLERPNTEFSSYLQDSWKPRPGLLVEAGLRQDWDALVRNASWSPRLGVAWAPPGLKETKISAGYSVLYDATSLRLFSRPQDQYALTTSFRRDGSVEHGPAASLFVIGDRPLASPFYQAWSAGVERRMPGGIYARLNVLRKRGRNGFTYANLVGTPRRPPPSLAASLGATQVDSFFELSNLRRDVFDSVSLSLQQSFHRQYEWMASYTRSRAFSNGVVDLSIDDPVIITENVGRMPWDAPNRFLSWGRLPLLPRKEWSLAYLVESRTGFPFSIEDEEGRLIGELNSRRFPVYFSLNLHVEHRFPLRGYYWAGRVGFNNITNRRNYNLVNNNTGSPQFLQFFGGQGRNLVFRIRWLGKAEKKR